MMLIIQICLSYNTIGSIKVVASVTEKYERCVGLIPASNIKFPKKSFLKVFPPLLSLRNRCRPCCSDMNV